VSDHTPRGTLVVLLGRTVLLIVARWFSQAIFYRFLERHNTLLPGVTLYVWYVYKWCFPNGEVLMV
jgi:hypothetical protein